MAGGIAITIGNTLLATSTTPHGFYIGLDGNRPRRGPAQNPMSAPSWLTSTRKAAHAWTPAHDFYIGINVGAFLGPLVDERSARRPATASEPVSPRHPKGPRNSLIDAGYKKS